MAVDSEISSLKKQRNWFYALAVISLGVSVALSLPRVLKRHAIHREANVELIRLQAEIVEAQGKIRAVQAEIVKVQRELNRPITP